MRFPVITATLEKVMRRSAFHAIVVMLLTFAPSLPRQAAAQIMVMAASPDASAGATKGAPGFQVPVDEALQAAFADFERHAGRKAWEKAFTALSELPPDKRTGMLEDGNGYLISAKERIWNALVSLPPDGREAYRIFFEPRAEKLFATLSDKPKQGPGEALKVLEELFDQYFLTSAGDNAADLLGDARFEQGQFDEAARCWTAILDHHPNTDLSEARLQVKRALALAQSGRQSEFDALRRQVSQRYATQKVALGGRDVNPAEFLEAIKPVGGPADLERTTTTPPGAPPKVVGPEWQVQFVSDRGNRQLTSAVSSNPWYRSGMETYVPVWAADGERVYCNWFGLCFAVDIATGKLLWRTEKFTQMYERFSNIQQYALDYDSFTIAAAEGVVLAVTVPADQLNNWQPQNRLIAYDAKTGAQKWKSADLSGLQNTSFTGNPVINGHAALVVTHEQGQTELTLRQINLSDGREIWSQKLGTAEGRTNRFRGNMTLRAPALLKRGDRLFVLVNSGAMVEFNLKTKAVASIFRFDKPPGGQGEEYFYYYAPLDETTLLHSRGALFEQDGRLYFKESGGTAMYAVDPAARKQVWKRPIKDSAQLVAVDASNCYLLSRELECIDRKTQELKWAVMLPVVGGGLSVVPAEEGILVFTSRGVFEIAKDNGDVTRIFRGEDLSSIGGSLRVVGGRAVCVSNRSITAYPLQAPQGEARGAGASQ
jgi:outer membrane protein assembly factor BamB